MPRAKARGFAVQQQDRKSVLSVLAPEGRNTHQVIADERIRIRPDIVALSVVGVVGRVGRMSSSAWTRSQALLPGARRQRRLREGRERVVPSLRRGLRGYLRCGYNKGSSRCRREQSLHV